MNTTQNVSIEVAGINFGGVTSIDYDTAMVKEEVLAPAVSTVLATRTGNSAGTLTLPGGHGLSTGRYDLYWTTASGVLEYQQGLTGTVSGDVMTLAAAGSGNGGTNLPSVSQVIFAAPSASFAMAVPTASITGFFFKSTGSNDASVRVVLDDASTLGFLCPVRGAFSWVAGASASPLSDSLVSFFASTRGTVAGGIAAAVIWSD